MIGNFPARARQIHLDFHTSPLIPGVGDRFDAEAFADLMVKARVDSVTLFAKCHHGHLYFNTDHPARHPTLGEGLLERQIEALRQRDIRCPIYISAPVDEFAANTHPEWRAVNADGSLAGRLPFSSDAFAWQILDMSSPYLEYLEAQTDEIVRKFAPVDGIFFDMCWDQPSVSKWALAGMRKDGLDPTAEADRNLYANRVTLRYMERLSAVVAKHQKDVPIWFNSRPIADASLERKFLRHLEIEALPTGQWGYAYFPIWVRYGKTLGLPTLAMTGRFHKSWSDFGGLRTPASLQYDCALALAHGTGCSVGDQLHPSGLVNPGVYEVIGAAYRHVEKCEPWCREVEPIKELAVLFVRPTAENPADRCLDGIVKTLSQLRYQFVFIDSEADWESYPVILVPEPFLVSAEMETRLQNYLAAGGKVLRERVPGEASPYTSVYLRFEASARGALPATEHVFYERGNRLVPQTDDEILARIVEPYFERSWDQFCAHAQTPNRLEESPYAAAVIRGNEALFALPVFRGYAEHGNIPCRQLVQAALQKLLPDPSIRLVGPAYVEVTVGTRPGEVILHFLSYLPQKRTPNMEGVEDAVAARNLVADVRVSGKVTLVKRVLDSAALSFEQEGSRVKITLDWLEGHEIVVIGYE